MKSRVYIIVLCCLSISAMFCGCAENANDGGKGEPMSFSAEISNRSQTRAAADTAKHSGANLTVRAAKPAIGITESVSKMTRSFTTDNNWPSGASIAIQKDGSTKQYTVDGSGNITSSSPFYWMNKNDVSITSWYPYNNGTMPSTWTVSGDQSTADKYTGASNATNNNATNDFLYATNKFSFGGNSNKLAYTHETAKVVINILKANDVTSVSSITIGTSAKPIDLSATVGSDGTLTGTTTTTGSITPYQQPTPTSSADAATYTALVIPQDMNGKQFISITVGSNTYYYQPSQSTPLKGGYEYDYDVTVPSAGSTVNVKDYYFSDGSWGKLEDHANNGVYPIGVIFSNTPSDIDKAHGWIHGYAMALTKANTSCIWSLPSSSSSTFKDETGDTYSDSYENFSYSNYTDLENDKDGYSETQAIKNKGKWLASNSFQSGYPAFWYALNYGTTNESTTTNYAAPKNNANSSWYLPSIGQWWDIVTNLGGMSTPTFANYSMRCRWYSKDDETGKDTNDYSLLCTNNINNLLNAIKKYTNYGYDLFLCDSNYGGYYWASSQLNINSSACVYFGVGDLEIAPGEKDDTFNVRAVIAF